MELSMECPTFRRLMRAAARFERPSERQSNLHQAAVDSELDAGRERGVRRKKQRRTRDFVRRAVSFHRCVAIAGTRIENAHNL